MVIAIVLTALVALIIKRTIVGRRFEAVGANPRAARAAGLELTRYQIGAYVGANLLYCSAGILLAGIVSTPSAFQGDNYLLPSVAAVVLGGTSLLGGRGSVVATAIGALFISQLDQFVLTTGVDAAVQYLVQAGALAAGIAVYSVPWGRLRERLRSNGRRRARADPATGTPYQRDPPDGRPHVTQRHRHETEAMDEGEGDEIEAGPQTGQRSGCRCSDSVGTRT